MLGRIYAGLLIEVPAEIEKYLSRAKRDWKGLELKIFQIYL